MGLFPAGKSVMFPGRWEAIKDAINSREDENKMDGKRKKKAQLRQETSITWVT